MIILNDAPSSTLLSLPEEVLTAIISCISDSCLVNLSEVCRKLNRICGSPLELRLRCTRFKWWEEYHEIEKKKALSRVTDVNWRQLFLRRVRVGLTTSHLLDEIIANPTNHINNFNRIVDFGYDAKDCLKKHAEVSDDEVDDPLARRYHATTAIRYIHRRRALSIWKRVRDHNDVPLEVALLALDLFVVKAPSPDVEDIVKDFDDLAASFLAATPEFSTYDTEEKAVKLIVWMWDRGFKGTPIDRYHALKNVFVGLTVRTIHSAIPLTLVAIFCAIARRVGLVAHPCGYPRHVLAIVEDDKGEYQYYDIFVGPGSNPRKPREELEAELPVEGAVRNSYMAPASVLQMVIRAAQNILGTLQLLPTERAQINHGYPEICENSMLYAALTVMVILKPGPITLNVVQHMTRQIPSDFPMDVRFLEEELLPRIQDQAGRQLLENVCGALRAEDTMPRTVSRRNYPENKCVLHRVGTIIRHRRYDYSGAIFGWTNECRPISGEDWIAKMGVETLPRGRKQPFYHVLVEDGTVRYVAEENIRPIKPKNVNSLIGLAGKYFKRFDPEEGKFVSNMHVEFPDD